MKTFAIAAAAFCQLALSGCAAVMTAAAAHPAAVAAAVDFVPFAVTVGAIGAIGLAGVAGSQPETHDPGTLGAFLQEKNAAVAAIVQGAMQDGREVVIVAGLQVQRSIARARIAFRESLRLKDDGLGAAEKAYKGELESSIAGLGVGENLAIKAAGDRAQSVADRLAVPAEAPQVRSFGPVYLFSSLPFQSITIRGSFPAAYPAGVVPQLKIDGRIYKAHSVDAQGLQFSIPAKDLADPESQAIAWRKAQLEIPWDKPIFDAFARAGFENFVVLGVLPHSAGRGTIEHRVNTVRREERARKSEDFAQDPVLGDFATTRCLELAPEEVRQGWRLKPGSGTFSAKAAAAFSWRDLGLQSQNDGSICWRAQPVHSERGPTGDTADEATWAISAVAMRDVGETRTESESFDLAWGARRVFKYPEGSWKLRYAKTIGSPAEFDRTDLTSPLVRVESDARGVTISAYPF
jgi:hypothetical protein